MMSSTSSYTFIVYSSNKQSQFCVWRIERKHKENDATRCRLRGHTVITLGCRMKDEEIDHLKINTFQNFMTNQYFESDSRSEWILTQKWNLNTLFMSHIILSTNGKKSIRKRTENNQILWLFNEFHGNETNICLRQRKLWERFGHK